MSDITYRGDSKIVSSPFRLEREDVVRCVGNSKIVGTPFRSPLTRDDLDTVPDDIYGGTHLGEGTL